jgi:hypothetical protein
VNVNVYDEAVASQLERMFFEDIARSREITKRKWFRRPMFDRLKESFAGVFKKQL